MNGKPVIINGEGISFDYLVPNNQVEKADLIIIATKYHQLNEALDLIEPVVAHHTQILTLLNGITSEEIIASRYGWHRTVYGLCFGIDAVREHNQINFGNIGRIVFGETDNAIKSERVIEIEEVLKRNHIPYEIPDDFLRIQWRKFMINVGSNLTSAVMLAPYGVYQRIPEAEMLMIDVMKEVMKIANAKGIALGQSDIDGYLELLPTFDPSGKSSTHQDMEANRKTEVEMFAGVVCSLGNEFGIETPLNDMLYKMIVTMEKMRA
jgi:2-dehydropantoate 2-reductase